MADGPQPPTTDAPPPTPVEAGAPTVETAQLSPEAKAAQDAAHEAQREAQVAPDRDALTALAKAAEATKAQQQAENHDTKADTQLKVDKMNICTVDYTALNAKIVALGTKLKDADNDQKLKAVQAELQPFVAPEFLTAITVIGNGRAAAENQIQLARNFVGPDVLRKIHDAVFGNFSNEYEAFNDPTKLSDFQNTFTTMQNKAAGVEKVAKAIKETPDSSSVPDEKFAELFDQLAKGESADAVVAKFNAESKSVNDAIEQQALVVKPNFADRIKDMANKAKPGGWKDMLMTVLGFLHSFGVTLNEWGIPGSSMLFTAQERLAANDPEVVWGSNSRRHMLKFKLPVDMVNRFNDAKVSDVITACTTRADEVDGTDEKIHKPRMALFAKTLKAEAAKVDGGQDKTVAEIMGNPELKGKINYRLPAAEPAPVAPAPPAAPPPGPVTPPETPPTAPVVPAAGAEAAPVTPTAPVAPVIAAATAAPATKPETPPPPPPVPEVAKEDPQVTYEKKLTAAFADFIGKTIDLQTKKFEFKLPFPDGTEAQCVVDKNDFFVDGHHYVMRLPSGADLKTITINGTFQDGKTTMEAGFAFMTQEKEISNLKLVEVLNVLKTGKTLHEVKVGDAAVSFEKVS